MTARPSFDVTISPFSQSVQKYYNNFACARFYFERIGNKCFHRGEGRVIDLLPYKEERYISSFWNEKTRITLPSSPVFCHAKYRGGVTQWRRGWKIPAVEVAEVRTPLHLLIADVIGEVTCRAGEVKETGKRCKIYPCVEMGITILIFSPCCIHVALPDISHSFLRKVRDWNDIIGVVFKTSSLPCPVALRGVLPCKI